MKRLCLVLLPLLLFILVSCSPQKKNRVILGFSAEVVKLDPENKIVTIKPRVEKSSESNLPEESKLDCSGLYYPIGEKEEKDDYLDLTFSDLKISDFIVINFEESEYNRLKTNYLARPLQIYRVTKK